MRVLEFWQDMDRFSPWTTEDGTLERISDSLALGSAAADHRVPLRGHIRDIDGHLRGDFPYWLDPLFSERAREGLADMLDPFGEWLPVVTANGGQYFIYNVTTIVDCIDHEGSELARFPGGRVYGANTLAFDAAAIGEQWCFRVPEGITVSFFMQGEVLEQVDALGLRGLAPGRSGTAISGRSMRVRFGSDR